MKFARANSLVWGLVFLLAACSSSNKKEFKKIYYQKNEQQWLSVLHSFGYKKQKLRNHILLVMHTTECPPCLHELEWWNRHGRRQINAKVSLVVTGKYRTTFQTFVNSHHIHFPSYRDSAAVLFARKLIPTEPLKIYFNKKGKVSLMFSVGQNGKIPAFLKAIKKQRE